MSQQRIPEDLKRSIPPVSSLGETPSSDLSQTKSFSSLMQPESSSMNVEQNIISPLQLPQVATAGSSNPMTILAQLQQAQSSMMQLQNQLKTPNLQLSSADQRKIKKQLDTADSSLQSAYQKMGMDVMDQNQQDAGGAPSKGSGPIAQFLNLLTDGIQQIESSKMLATNIGKQGILSPGEFLMIQLKLAKAQQQLEFTGVLLSKTIDGFKQIMGVQL